MSREAMQQARAALVAAYPLTTADASLTCEQVRSAIAALEAALAEQAQPVAWYDPTNKASDQAFAYPDVRDKWPHIYKVPLYTTPPAPVAPQPLTEREMYEIEDRARREFTLSQRGPRGQQITYWDSLTPWLIRAVEAAVLERMGVQR